MMGREDVQKGPASGGRVDVYTVYFLMIMDNSRLACIVHATGFALGHVRAEGCTVYSVRRGGY